VLLADEPTAQLDAASARALIGSMRALVGRGVTLVVTSHERAVIDAARSAEPSLRGASDAEVYRRLRMPGGRRRRRDREGA